MKIHRSASEPPRGGMTTEELWHGADYGLIACWERGFEKAREDSALAKRAKNGELITLAWKGGISKKLKTKTKYGVFKYVAMWQGLQGEDLNIDTNGEHVVTCSKFGVPVIFTNDIEKYGEV